MERWTDKALKDLDLILANYSMQSYLQMNRKKDGTYYKKRRPYSIPNEGLQALEYMRAIRNDEAEELEEEIKAFLLPYRTHRTEYLQEIHHSRFAL